MKKDKGQQQVEKEILETLRAETSPFELSGIVDRVSRNGTEARTAREAIRTLVDKGILQVTLDWKLRLREQNGNGQRA